MGFFKWLDKHIRASNANDFSSYRAYAEKRAAEEAAEKKQREAEEAAERARRKTLECCANCIWFMDGLRRCTEHDVSYNVASDDHYRYYCADFRWKDHV